MSKTQEWSAKRSFPVTPEKLLGGGPRGGPRGGAGPGAGRAEPPRCEARAAEAAVSARGPPVRDASEYGVAAPRLVFVREGMWGRVCDGGRGWRCPGPRGRARSARDCPVPPVAREPGRLGRRWLLGRRLSSRPGVEPHCGRSWN